MHVAIYRFRRADERLGAGQEVRQSFHFTLLAATYDCRGCTVYASGARCDDNEDIFRCYRAFCFVQVRLVGQAFRAIRRSREEEDAFYREPCATGGRFKVFLPQLTTNLCE